MHTEPWNLNPYLTKECLVILANFIKTVRSEVIERHDVMLGDTPQSLGFRCYECCRTRLNQKEEQKEWDWFSIVRPDGRFTFSINGVPVRLTRNAPEELPNRKLIVSSEAIKQMDLLKEFYPEYATLIWFFVFDTYYKNPADNVYFVGYSETGEIICQYEISLEDKAPVFGLVDSKKPEAVKQQKPPVTLKSQFKADKKENGK